MKLTLIQIGLLALAMLFAGCAHVATVAELQKADHKPKTLVYRNVADKPLHVQVYFPDGRRPAKPRPAIIMIHGGGWAGGGPDYFAPHCRYFASRGMVAVNVEYRLVSKDTGVRIADCVADCVAAFRFVLNSADELGIDTGRVAVAGASAGGHLAACLAMLPDPEEPREKSAASRPGAAILYNPCLDLVGLSWMNDHLGVAPTPDTPEGETWQDRAKKVSPMEYIRPGLPPMLLIHGTKDNCVPIEQTDRFAEKMKAEGNRIDYSRMTDWNHAFVVLGYGPDAQVAEALRITDRFLASLGYLEGKPTIEEPGPQPPGEMQ